MATCYDRLSFRCAVLLCVGMAGCQGAGGSGTCQMVHVTDLALTQQQRAFFTNVQINGQNATLQFDTGSEDNILTESAARRLGMTVNINGYDTITGVGGEQETGTARSHNVRLGEAHGEDLTFTTVPEAPLYDGADGLLGMRFLYGYDLDLDFADKRVGVFKALGDCSTPAAALAPPLYSVDLVQPNFVDSTKTDLSPVVAVSINGITLRAAVDTGAPHTLIFRDSAHRVGLTGPALMTGLSHGVGPRQVAFAVRLSTPVSIGDLTVKNMPLMVAGQKHPDVDMLLGYDFVTRVHLWISRSSRTLIMQFPPQPSGKR